MDEHRREVSVTRPNIARPFGVQYQKQVRSSIRDHGGYSGTSGVDIAWFEKGKAALVWEGTRLGTEDIQAFQGSVGARGKSHLS